jgi:acyl carrier protein
MSNLTGNEDPKTVAIVGDVIADVFGLPREDVTETTERDDIPEWDSLGHLNLMLALEDAFNISFTVDEMPDLVSVPAIVAKVIEKCR